MSRTLLLGGQTRIELLLDVLNALGDTAEGALATDNLFSPNFGQPTVFVDPRRVMIGARLNWADDVSAGRLRSRARLAVAMKPDEDDADQFTYAVNGQQCIPTASTACMRDALIVSAVRTPIGRAGGALASVRADDLAAVALRGAVERVQFDPARLDDVILGCANQAGEDNRNVARMAVLLAGFPVEIPGQTVNRLCGSGLQAVASAAQAIKAGEGDAFIAGGVESMTRAPYVMLKTGNAWSRQAPTIADSTVGWRFINPQMPAQWTTTLGMTAEKVAEDYGISREAQDAFAAESQRRAAHAIREGVFRDEIVPVCIPQEGRAPVIVSADEHPRPDTTPQALAALKPAFSRAEHASVTAGNSSGINDGASALLVVADTEVADMKPLARIVTTAVAGVDPSVMGIGPVPAARKALTRAGLTIDQIDLVELNEAFAAQSLACIRELGVDPEKVNVYGGAIALGHPLGSSGSRLVATLVHALRRRNARYGLATMCIGVGQGIATIVERL